MIDSSGIRRPLTDRGLEGLFKKTMVLGALIDSGSPDVAELLPALEKTAGGAFASIPLKAMGEDVGCLLLRFGDDRLPLSKDDVNFMTWLGRQIAGSLMLMLHLNEEFLKTELSQVEEEQRTGDGDSRHRFETLIGKSESMKKIFRTLDRIKNTDSGILILGESPGSRSTP